MRDLFVMCVCVYFIKYELFSCAWTITYFIFRTSFDYYKTKNGSERIHKYTIIYNVNI